MTSLTPPIETLAPVVSAASGRQPETDEFRATVVEADEGRVVIAVPGTEYRLWLRPISPLPAIRARLGRRIAGRVAGRALRLHPAAAGGRFIEPIDGVPRIVQGAVLAVDGSRRSVLLDVGIPIRLELLVDQPLESFAPGSLWNCYIESGATFAAAGEPADETAGGAGALSAGDHRGAARP
ncbi:MAG TPA: hypothetical protein PKC43_12905 [Phycisphaerales bacterium]|nr:hypothetical protein [Phycisphaerales bacterium]HMP38333.1 hypothetical protein [Phycisphaerales bacterium]